MDLNGISSLAWQKYTHRQVHYNIGKWSASEHPKTRFNMIQRKAPFVCLLIPGTLDKIALLLRCSCRIGWKRWSVLMTSSMSMACCVIACSVSKGGYTGQYESYNKSATKIQLWSPITLRSCHNGHHKECKTRAKDSEDSGPDFKLHPFLWAS